MNTEIKSTSAQIIGGNTGPKTQSPGQRPGLENNNTEAKTASTDTVSVTSEAERLLKLEDKLADLPVVDTARVQEIKASIADGSFEVNAERIASKLMQFETGKE